MNWQRCERCGAGWPEFFNVPGKVWRHYILALGAGDKMLCIDCFNLITELTDGGAFARKHGGAVMLSDIWPDAPEGSEGRARWDSRQKRMERRRRIRSARAATAAFGILD